MTLMDTAEDGPVDTANEWRVDTPGVEGWTRTARRGDPHKYFMVSADCHANEPAGWLAERIDEEFRDRVPRIETDADGVQWVITEGYRPQRVASARKTEDRMQAEDRRRSASGRDPEDRIADHRLDGVDVEVIFPNKGLTNWATPDPVFAAAMCRAWNRYALDTYGDHFDVMLPMACLSPGAKDETLAEIEWAAEHGFRGTTLPCKPYWGAHDADKPNYNLPELDWLWAAHVDHDLATTFHVSTGRDPRAARGDGGAVINYVTHSLSPTMEPVANLCASGVLDRFPGLRFATIEAGIGWVPWALEAMDEAYRKHHMWVLPRLDLLPSEYFRRQGFASFQEDLTGLLTAEELDLTGNYLWANDYPHHEGSWPHSAEAIERQMGHLSDDSRARILGLNAARLFRLDVPS